MSDSLLDIAQKRKKEKRLRASRKGWADAEKGTYENRILLYFQTLRLHVDMEQLQNTLKASRSACSTF